MEVFTLPVGQLTTNCYLLADPATEAAIIVDPGDDAQFIIQKVLDERLKVEAILATHGHFDHVLAVNELKLAFNVPFLMHGKDQFLLDRLRQTTKHFTGFDPGPAPKVDQILDRELRFEVGAIQLDIIKTPGHTPGSVSYYQPQSHQLWVGDVVFAGGAVGSTEHTYSSAADLDTSIKTLFALPDQTMIYAGHGESFYLEEEKRYHQPRNL
ncbi:hypothetical protein A3B57_00115 [Microgenomates group bacterium RIFCSPLOWO2_01_FULL_47_10]|nr:MAG: hypothetical protein A3B57_00115 [Microgenomates group bacterium RIFCSPLOWO2_01_FULL_47_10]